MLLVSTKHLLEVAVLPPETEGGEPALAYTYAVGTMPERSLYERDIETAGAKFFSPKDIRQTLREFLGTLDEDDEGRRAHAFTLLDRLDTQGAVVTGEAEAPGETESETAASDVPPVGTDGGASADGTVAVSTAAPTEAALSVGEEQAKQDVTDQALLNEVAVAAGAEWPPYNAAIASRAHWIRTAALCAVRRFARGCKGTKAHPFSAPHGMVEDATLKRMGWGNIIIVGNAIVNAMSLTEAEAKN